MVKHNGKLLKDDWSTLKQALVENMVELEARWKHVNWDQNTDELARMWCMTDKLEWVIFKVHSPALYLIVWARFLLPRAK